MTKTQAVQSLIFQKLVVERGKNSVLDELFLGSDPATHTLLDFDAIYDIKLLNGKIYEGCTIWRRGPIESNEGSLLQPKEMRRFRTSDNIPNDLDEEGLTFRLNILATSRKKLTDVDKKLQPLYRQRDKVTLKIAELEAMRAKCK